MASRTLHSCALRVGVAAAIACLAGLGHASGAAAASPEATLADRYAPVVRLVAQSEPCAHGEPYEPENVNVVLGNQSVALRGPWSGANLVKVAPTASDLAQGLFGYSLDYPGDALSPGCTYDKWSHSLAHLYPPTTYAHISTQSDYPGTLALQYWFFYVYNDFNDKHEGDWEMIQLDFPAASAAAALDTKPSEVGYSQHDGAERATWGDAKLQIVDGTHPVVYPALGSHANYYSSALYLGRSAVQGVGCDDTLGPSRQLRPVVALIPTGRQAYLRAYPWLGYQGRWGERHPGFYDGPPGPNENKKWQAPLTWAHTSWRDTSYTVPVGGSFGHAATDLFCGAVAGGSNLLTVFVADPWPVLLGIAAIVALLLWLASRTRWDVSAPFRLAHRRPWGSLLTAALRLYGGNARLFLAIGLLFLPLGLLITIVQYLIFQVGTLEPLVSVAGESNPVVAVLAVALGLIFTIVGFTFVQAATTVAMLRLDERVHVTAPMAYAVALRRLRPLLRALGVAVLVVAVLGLTAVGAAVGAWLAVRWSLLTQTVIVDDGDVRPLRASARLAGSHWWRTASITLFVTGTAIVLGPVIGVLLLLITSASFDFVNMVSAIVYVVALPFAAITTTYLYFDLAVRHRQAAADPGVDIVLPSEL
jgi:hypothetical protein